MFPMIKPIALLLVASLALFAAGDPPAAPARVGYAWPLPTCIVSGEPLGDKPVVKVLEDAKDPSVNGREVRFCCEKCAATFDANRAKCLKDADAAIIAREMPAYTLTNCMMMPDEKLPAPDAKEQDGARSVVVGNQLVRVCCAQCERKVKRNPAAVLTKVQTALVAAITVPSAFTTYSTCRMLSQRMAPRVTTGRPKCTAYSACVSLAAWRSNHLLCRPFLLRTWIWPSVGGGGAVISCHCECSVVVVGMVSSFCGGIVMGRTSMLLFVFLLVGFSAVLYALFGVGSILVKSICS
jgi:hypothetical protein